MQRIVGASGALSDRASGLIVLVRAALAAYVKPEPGHAFSRPPLFTGCQRDSWQPEDMCDVAER